MTLTQDTLLHANALHTHLHRRLRRTAKLRPTTAKRFSSTFCCAAGRSASIVRSRCPLYRMRFRVCTTAMLVVTLFTPGSRCEPLNSRIVSSTGCIRWVLQFQEVVDVLGYE